LTAFVLEVDVGKLNWRLDERPEMSGRKTTERNSFCDCTKRKKTRRKNRIFIDATAPFAHVVDEIVPQSEQVDSHNAGAW
jgi:hypothetical protein